MSVAIGSGTTTAREARWVMLAILFIALFANHAFGMPGKPKPPVRQPRTVPATRVCVVRAGVPTCVVLGTFPNNPAWGRIRGGSR